MIGTDVPAGGVTGIIIIVAIAGGFYLIAHRSMRKRRELKA